MWLILPSYKLRDKEIKFSRVWISIWIPEYSRTYPRSNLWRILKEIFHKLRHNSRVVICLHLRSFSNRQISHRRQTNLSNQLQKAQLQFKRNKSLIRKKETKEIPKRISKQIIYSYQRNSKNWCWSKIISIKVRNSILLESELALLDQTTNKRHSSSYQLSSKQMISLNCARNLNKNSIRMIHISLELQRDPKWSQLKMLSC